MKTCFKIGIYATLGLLLICTNGLSYDFTYRLSANQNALDTSFEATFDVSQARLAAGVGGFYDNDDYELLFMQGMIVNQIITDGLTGGLGFKGVWGEAEKRSLDGDVLNLGFMGYAGYDLKASGLADVPLTISASLSLSPEPLSFGDTEEFLEVFVEGAWKILDEAAVVINYRYIEIDFEKSNRNIEKSDNAGYLGLKFFF